MGPHAAHELNLTSMTHPFPVMRRPHICRAPLRLIKPAALSTRTAA